MMLRDLIAASRRPLPTRSLNFVRSNSQYLSMNDANFGAFNLDKFAFSAMLKWNALSVEIGFVGQAESFRVFRNGGNNLVAAFGTAGVSLPYNLITSATYSNDTWYHVYIIWDGQNATADDRMRMFINGIEIISFSGRNNPPQASLYNSSSDIFIGKSEVDDYTNGQIYQPALFSGTIPSASDLFANSKPKRVKGLPGLHSALITRTNIALENDAVRASNWTNNNSVIRSTELPL